MMTDTMPYSPPQAADESATDRKKLILAGVAGAAVLAAGGFFFLSGGSSDDVATGPVVTHHVTSPAVHGRTVKAPPKTPTKAKPVTLPAASSARLGRDPFKPLYVAPVENTTPATGGEATPAPATGSTATTPTATTVTAPYVLKLTSIDSSQPSLRRYTFSVAGTGKTVVSGQKFGKYGELVVLAVVTDSHNKASGALIQVGDSNPQSIAVGGKSTVA